MNLKIHLSFPDTVAFCYLAHILYPTYHRIQVIVTTALTETYVTFDFSSDIVFYDFLYLILL